MEAWQQRVVDEKNELTDKIEKLNRFLGLKNDACDALNSAEITRLRRQRYLMVLYVMVLDERIENF